MFADDTNVVTTANTQEELQTKSQLVISHITDWLSVNRISVNVKKCSSICFTGDNLSNIVLKGTTLETTDRIKYLGVIIDSALTFRPQFELLVSKLNQAIGIIRKLQNLLSFETKLLLYYSLFHSHLSYCTIVYGYRFKEYTSTVDQIQKRALSLIFKCSQRHVPSKMIEYGILSFENHLKLQTALLMFKAYHRQLPKFLQNRFTRYRDVHNRESISRFNFVIQRTNSRLEDNCLTHSGTKLWNSLPNSIKSEHKTNVFKRLLKLTLLTNQT